MDSALAVVRDLVLSARGAPAAGIEGPRWSDLGLDSLDLLELVEASERLFEIAIPDRLAARLRGPDDLATLIRALAPTWSPDSNGQRLP